MERKDVSLYTADELEAVDVDMGEQEFSVSCYRTDDRVSLWVSDNTMLTKIKKCMKANPKEWKLEQIAWTKEGTVGSYEFSFPKKYLVLKAKSKEYSEEQLEKLKERGRKMSEARKSKE